MPYTLPVIDNGGKLIKDSLAIAQYLEEHYPDGSQLFPEHSLPLVRLLEAQARDAALAVYPLIIPATVELLDKEGAEYYRRTREARLGHSLEAIHTAPQSKIDGMWKASEKSFGLVGRMLEDNPEGPFVLGKTRSYADIVIVAMLNFSRRCDTKIFERIMSFHPAFGKLLEACQDLLRDI